MDIVRRRGREMMGLAEKFRTTMDDMFGRFLEDWGLTPFEGRAWTPALDVAETESEIVVKADVPGMKPEDIELSVHGNTLTICGEKKAEKEERREEYYHVERRYGAFRRDLALPSEVDADKIEATEKDGVLTIRLPKTETSKPRRIKVKG